MTRYRLASVVAALVAATGLLTAAPASAASQIEVVDVDTTSLPTVAITVAAPAELAATGGAGDAFSVLENGESRDIEVERVSTDGLEVVVVLDTSGSMQGAPIDGARAAAASFVRSLPADVPVAVVGFGSRPVVASPFSTDREAQVAGIGALKAAGETALYDAIAFTQKLPPTSAVRRALVVLSDGGDTVSSTTLDAAVALLRDGRTKTTVVELATGETDRAALERLAAANGGRVIQAGNPQTLAEAYARTAADLVGRFRITFASKASGATDVLVRLDAPGGEQTARVRVDLPARPAPAPEPAPLATHTADPGLFSGSAALVVGAASLFFGLAIAAFVGIGPRRRVGASRLGAVMARGSGTRSLSSLAQRATEVADRQLDRNGRRSRLEALLEQGGVSLRAAELIVLAAVGAAAAFLVGLLLSGMVGGLLLGVVALAGVRTYLVFRRDRRQSAFAGQLDDVLRTITASLRAGYGLLQAVETAGRESEAPAGDEFRRLTAEVRLGRDLAEALEAMADRVGSEDFGWVASSIRINRETGGDLAEVLDHVSETIRARGHLRRQVKALSAEGRLSAYILFALPFAAGGMISLTNPGYLSELGHGVGLLFVAGGITLMAAGGLWLRKLVRLTY